MIGEHYDRSATVRLTASATVHSGHTNASAAR